VQAPALPQRAEQPNYFRLRNTPRGVTPVRVAMLLPFTNPSADTRGVAQALQRAAEMALFDSRNANIILLPRDDGGSPERAAAAAAQAIDDGAEIILGPLFAQSAAAVRPVARRLGVPVIAFSTDRSVGGDGVYLLSFQPETEVQRIVSYAARNGHSNFAALVPQSAYGDLVADAFRDTVMRSGGRVTTVQVYPARAEALAAPARQVAASQPDAVLIGDAGANLRALGSSLAINAGNRVKLLGTGLWNDPAIQREPSLTGGWFAAPAPEGWNRFVTRYRGLYNAAPPRIATLGYDAMSLVALLSRGQPYRRYTPAALTDPNGFNGIDGIFRFRADGSAERGLAVLQVRENGFTVVEQAPRSFQGAGG
jgi:ABC-type branched-subunit amino acid transport system substrate-binding protein